ncbi:MAG: hypothetical protein ACO1OH_00725, partial [Limnobacter sp.]
MKPTAANQLKRGGFLEVRPKQSRRRVGSNPQSAPICKFSSQHSRAAPRHLRATHGGVQWSIGTGESPSPRNSRLISSP